MFEPCHEFDAGEHCGDEYTKVTNDVDEQLQQLNLTVPWFMAVNSIDSVAKSTTKSDHHEIAELINLLKSDSEQERQNARIQLAAKRNNALPELIKCMASTDPHERREATSLALAILKPAQKLLKQEADLLNLSNTEIALSRSTDLSSDAVIHRRIGLRMALLSMTEQIDTDEARALSKVKAVLANAEKTMLLNSVPSGQSHKRAIELCKKQIEIQEDLSIRMPELVHEFVRKTMDLIVEANRTNNGMNKDDCINILNLAFKIGIPGYDKDVIKTMRALHKQTKGQLPKSLLKDFRQVGGIDDMLGDPEYDD